MFLQQSIVMVKIAQSPSTSTMYHIIILLIITVDVKISEGTLYLGRVQPRKLNYQIISTKKN